MIVRVHVSVHVHVYDRVCGSVSVCVYVERVRVRVCEACAVLCCECVSACLCARVCACVRVCSSSKNVLPSLHPRHPIRNTRESSQPFIRTVSAASTCFAPTDFVG